MLDKAIGTQQVRHRASPSPAGGIFHVNVKITSDKEVGIVKSHAFQETGKLLPNGVAARSDLEGGL